MAQMDTSLGIRLLGVGVANFVTAAQEELFELEAEQASISEDLQAQPVSHALRRRHGWTPGEDVEHDEMGRGWVWGSGRGLVTVRFETRHTPIGPVRTLPADDPALHKADPLPMEWEVKQVEPHEEDLWQDPEGTPEA
jgi:DNA polymerase-4